MLAIPQTTHSANVTLRIVVGTTSYELGQIGPDMLVFQDDCELPPCDGEIVMTIDGREYRSHVRLPEGRRSGEAISRSVRADIAKGK